MNDSVVSDPSNEPMIRVTDSIGQHDVTLDWFEKVCTYLGQISHPD